MSTNASEGRTAVRDRAAESPWSLLRRWEAILLVFLGIVFVINSNATPYFLNIYNLADSTFNFSEKAIIALPMALVIIARDIDISVASIIALSSMLMGLAAEAGLGVPGLVVVGLATGATAGAFNGFLIAGLGLPAIVVTIGTFTLFRGIAFVALGDGAVTQYPAGLAYFGQGYIGGLIPFEFVLFLVLAVIFGVLLHMTVIGRRIYAIGNNPVAARFTGIRVDRYRFVLFCLTGLMSGLAAVLLTSRIGSTRPNIALGWELEIITMVVLGGVSILGGIGTILGVVIAVLLVGMVTFGFGLLNVPGIIMTVFIGSLLIVTISIPVVIQAVRVRAAARASSRR